MQASDLPPPPVATEPTTEKQPRKKPVRRVFGRRVVCVEGHDVRFELRADGLHVKRLRVSRKKEKHLTFVQLRDVADGQKILL